MENVINAEQQLEAAGKQPVLLFDNLLEYPQAASFLGISVRHLKRLKVRGKVPYVQIGRLVRFRVASLDRWAQRKEVS